MREPRRPNSSPTTQSARLFVARPGQEPPIGSLPPAIHARLGIAAAVLLGSIELCGVAHAQTPKSFLEYLKPTPITCSPLSDASWGDPGVLPRDLCNGIEDAKGKAVAPGWYYWDGQIIKAKDGKYHMFHSTWEPGTVGFQRWTSSDAFHSISETSVLGPYKRQDYIYSSGGSHKGHNVTAVELPDGTYAVVVGEIVPLTIYKASSLDGPWTACSPSSQVGASNVSLFPREDGKFQIVERNGTIAISDTLCGTYIKQKVTCSYPTANSDTIYPKRTSTPGVTNPTYAWQEDPHIWRSGGTYNVIYSGSGDRVGWHVYSADGLTNWKDNGYAWSPREYKKIFCYEGSTTCNQWYKMERPSVVLENGHPTHVTWAVADVDKDTQIPAGSNHGSKIIVVPFDGVAFDNDFGVGGKDGGVDPATDASVGTGGSGGRGGASGGTTGTGTSSGGAGGTASGAGGSTGVGGSASDGGRGGAGGAATAGTSGAAGAGGATTGTSGSARTGGATGSSSATGSGGAVGAGGAAGGKGGSDGTGARSSSGGNASGGVTGNSGGSTGHQGGGSGTSTQNGSTTSGCGCAVGGHAPVRFGASLLLLGSVFLSLIRRRRPRA